MKGANSSRKTARQGGTQSHLPAGPTDDLRSWAVRPGPRPHTWDAGPTGHQPCPPERRLSARSAAPTCMAGTARMICFEQSEGREAHGYPRKARAQDTARRPSAPLSPRGFLFWAIWDPHQVPITLWPEILTPCLTLRAKPGRPAPIAFMVDSSLGFFLSWQTATNNSPTDKKNRLNGFLKSQRLATSRREPLYSPAGKTDGLTRLGPTALGLQPCRW